MKRAVILTGPELRHHFFHLSLAREPGLAVLKTYCEAKKPLTSFVRTEEDKHQQQAEHAKARDLSEQEFFASFVKENLAGAGYQVVPTGYINTPECYQEIVGLAPDLILSYGCSIVKDPLLSHYAGRFINVHLGLSPYYRGAGTNFWPLVRGEPEFVGATFMHIDHGIDTGEIIHQIRAKVEPGDDAHRIGNRLILDMTRTMGQLVRCFDQLAPVTAPELLRPEIVCRKKDFSPQAVEQLTVNFAQGMVETYLQEHTQRWAKAPIAQNPGLKGWQP